MHFLVGLIVGAFGTVTSDVFTTEKDFPLGRLAS